MANQRRALGIIFLTVFIDLLGFGIVLPLLPLYGKRLGASYYTLGLLLSSFSAMQFLFSPIWGRISDRVGRRPILILGLLGSVIFYSLFGLASRGASLSLMFIARIGAGIAGATISTAQAYIADCTPAEQRTRGMALIGAAFGIGFTFGPMLGALALWIDPGEQVVVVASEPGAEVGGMNSTVAVGGKELSPMPGFLAAGVSGIALALALFALPESLAEGSRAPRHDWLEFGNLRLALATPTVAPLVLTFFVATLAFAMFESTLALVSKLVFGFSDRENFFLFTYTGAALILAQGFFVRRLSKRIGDRELALLGVALLTGALLGLIGGLVWQSLAILLVLMVVAVHGFAAMTTSLQSMISQRSRKDQQGGILGVNQAGSALARILGPIVGITLFGQVDITAPYWLGMGLLMLAGGLLSRLDSTPVEETPITPA